MIAFHLLLLLGLLNVAINAVRFLRMMRAL
jgi:hypothetical protein